MILLALIKQKPYIVTDLVHLQYSIARLHLPVWMGIVPRPNQAPHDAINAQGLTVFADADT